MLLSVGWPSRCTGRRPRSVLLVGPAGVGKTAAVRELVRRRYQFGLGETPFWATSGSRLVAGMSGSACGRSAAATSSARRRGARAVVHLGNLVELMEVGKSEHSSRASPAFLRPLPRARRAAGGRRMHPRATPGDRARRPAPARRLHQCSGSRSRRPTQALAILRRVAERLRPAEPRRRCRPRPSTTLDRLHRRYATYSAYPGRPLRFLTNLLRDHRPRTRPIDAADVSRAPSRARPACRCCCSTTTIPLDLDRGPRLVRRAG